MAAKEVSLKLLVDKRTNQVLFAEADKDFVDIILSFLTMPIGTLLRLLGKQTLIGSMTTLYESVEDLDEQFLQTKACKNMLLHPQNAYEEKLQKLLVTFEDTEISYYLCPNGGTVRSVFGTVSHGISSVRNTLCCECGQEMNQKITERKKNVARDLDDGVFVKGLLRYLITDDLLVLPASSMASLGLLKRHGISDKTWLEEKNVKVGREEVFRLFERLLLSETLLTDAFLRKDDTINILDFNPRDLIQCKSKIFTCEVPKKININIKLLWNKSTGKVILAEAGEGFMDFLFSFLTLPLGSICKFLGGCTTFRSLDNLYQSVQDDISPKDKSELLNPKLPEIFFSANQLFDIEYIYNSRSFTVRKCMICTSLVNCFIGFDNCLHKETTTEDSSCYYSPCNPKLGFRANQNEGRTFLKGPATFTVTDNLEVKVLSPMEILSHFDSNKFPSAIEEEIVCVGEEEAVALLRAALISKTALSDFFCSMKESKSGNDPRTA